MNKRTLWSSAVAAAALVATLSFPESSGAAHATATSCTLGRHCISKAYNYNSSDTSMTNGWRAYRHSGGVDLNALTFQDGSNIRLNSYSLRNRDNELGRMMCVGEWIADFGLAATVTANFYSQHWVNTTSSQRPHNWIYWRGPSSSSC